jgi:hypothetical protein
MKNVRTLGINLKHDYNFYPLFRRIISLKNGEIFAALSVEYCEAIVS